MSDHGAGPRSIANPEIDITDVYAFPSPEREGHLVAVMDVFPFAAPSALFSDAIDYRIRMRPLRAVSTGPQTAFAVGEEERASALPSPCLAHWMAATASFRRGPVVGHRAISPFAWVTKEERRRTVCASSPGAGRIRSSLTRSLPGESGSIVAFRTKSPA